MSHYFSIILPVYNVAAYLERCIHSILSQSFTDYEIILVDDGATDDSPAICDRYANEYRNIHVIHKANGGLSSARNAGMAAAQGEYIWFVDSDDWIEHDALDMLYGICAQTPADIVKFSYFRSEEGKKSAVELKFDGMYSGEVLLNELRRLALCEPGRYTLSVWSHIYRRSFLDTNLLEFVSERMIGSEDYLFNLIALMHASSIRVIDHPLYCYELRSSSLTQQYKPDLSQRYTRLYRMLKSYVEKNDVCAAYDVLIDRFYVWHLMFGTCFQHEYHMLSDEHNLRNARINVKHILNMQDFSRAVRCCDCSGLTWKRKVLLLAMCLKIESVFFWLFVARRGHTRE